MEKKKFLIVEKNLIKAMAMEKDLIALGLESIGIATDYLTSMILIKDTAPDVVYLNPNLTLEAEGLGVAIEIEMRVKCKIFVFTSGLSEILKERFIAAHSYVFIDEMDPVCLSNTVIEEVNCDKCEKELM
ncbi:MAG: hypothetical protein ACJA0Q_002227 [Saprospiraceae bacterium]|jgi:hypothetical protein